MKKTKKTRIAALLLVLVTLFTALFIPINAAEADTSEDIGIEEIMPMAANSCGIWDNGIYYNYNLFGPPNSTYTDNTGKYKKIYYYDECGHANMVVHYTDHFSSGSHANPHYHTFSAVENERLGGLCWTENSNSAPWIE